MCESEIIVARGPVRGEPDGRVLGMTLDVGCGKRKIEPDAIGIDVSPDSAADHVWNLDQYPWPLADDCFDAT